MPEQKEKKHVRGVGDKEQRQYEHIGYTALDLEVQSYGKAEK